MAFTVNLVRYYGFQHSEIMGMPFKTVFGYADRMADDMKEINTRKARDTAIQRLKKADLR